MKKLITLLMLSCLVCNTFASTKHKKSKVFQTKKIEIKTEKKEIPEEVNFSTFPKSLIGMNDDEKESKERSINDGVSLQYIATKYNVIKESNLDIKELTFQINAMTKTLGNYFKEKKDIKGLVLIRELILISKKEPFNILETNLKEISESDKLNLEKTQILINKMSEKVEKDGETFYFFDYLDKIKFKPENSSNDNIDLSTIEKNIYNDSKDQKPILFYNENQNKLSLSIYYLYGVNGFLIPDDENNILKIIDEMKDETKF